MRFVIPGAALAAFVAGAGHAAVPASPPLAWIITPADGACRTELELAGRSGATVPISLTSDGAIVSLRFAKDELPERAFLPLRVDQKRFSNLMLRSPDARSGEVVLSEETEAALKKGKTLAIAWLGEEPISGSLAGSEQGLADLRTCGEQASAQARARDAAETAEKARRDSEARAKAVADAQVRAAQAQAAAADAERERVAEVADRQRRAEAAEADRQYAEQRQREYEAAQARARPAYPYPAYREAPRGYYEDEDPRWAPPPPPQPQPWPPVYRRRY